MDVKDSVLWKRSNFCDKKNTKSRKNDVYRMTGERWWWWTLLAWWYRTEESLVYRTLRKERVKKWPISGFKKIFFYISTSLIKSEKLLKKIWRIKLLFCCGRDWIRKVVQIAKHSSTISFYFKWIELFIQYNLW